MRKGPKLVVNSFNACIHVNIDTCSIRAQYAHLLEFRFRSCDHCVIVSAREEVGGNDELTTGAGALIAINVLSVDFLIYAWSVTVDRIRLSS